MCEEGTNTSVIYEGGFASLACGMQFSGSIRLWHSVWRRNNMTLSSVDEDVDEYIRRTVTFPAYSKDSGLYTCVISNQKPAYYSQCDVVIHVVGKYLSHYNLQDNYAKVQVQKIFYVLFCLALCIKWL